MLLSVAVESHEGEVTDAGAVVLHPVSDGDGVDARAPVDQIVGVRVAVPCASAVDDNRYAHRAEEVGPITADRLERFPAGAIADSIVGFALSRQVTGGRR